MAVPTSLFITLSLMFLNVHSRPDVLELGSGDSSGTVEVGQSGRKFYILENMNILLPCDIRLASSQITDHGWLKGKTRLPPGNEISSLSLDLVLENVSLQDEGEYRCIVETRAGVILGPTHTVLYPVFSVISQEVNVEGYVNQSIVLHCPIHSVPRGEISWNSSERNITTETTRYKRLLSGNLLILNLQPEDSRLFHCMATNPILNNEKRLSVHLNVTLAPTTFGPQILDSFPENLTLSSETQDFYCLGSGNPLPRSSWIISAHNIQDDPSSRVPHQPQADPSLLGSLLRLNMENGSARYDCIVTVSSEQQISKSMDTQLPSNFPNLPTLKYPAAKTVRFECKSKTTTTSTGISSSRSSGNPSLIWYKNGERLQTNSGRVKGRNNELVISNTVLGDSGFYQCEVGSYLGTGRLIIEASIERLSPPMDVTCSSSTSRSIHVHWQRRPDENVRAFTVHYVLADGGEEKQQVTNNTNYSLDGLRPNTNYSIYIRAYSGKSASGQSERVYCFTSDESRVPSLHPFNLQFHVIGNNSVQLTWEMNKINTGSVISYVVEVTTMSNQKNESSIILTNNTWVTLENLVESTNYLIRVLAETTTSSERGSSRGTDTPSSTVVFRISNNLSNQSSTSTLNSSTTSTTPLHGTGNENPGSSSAAASEDGFLQNEKNLGLILGGTLGLASIVICGTVIIWRNRCFSFIVRRGRRTRRGSYVAAGTGVGKDTVDSSAPMEMKVLPPVHLDYIQLPHHLDTKGGHPNGGVFDSSVSDPLMGRGDGSGKNVVVEEGETS